MTASTPHIAVITSTRADWGLLSPVASELRRRGLTMSVIAANMHFIARLGDTCREIEADGFSIAARIMPGPNPAATAAATLSGTADALTHLHPDGVLLLGDRYEMLAAAQAAAIARIPIVHIAGGTVSEGAFDDSFRHAITKMAALHLVETDDCRRRVMQLGEDPAAIVVTGAIGLHNLLAADVMPRHTLEESLGFSLGDDCLLATMHPATLSELEPQTQMANFLEALGSLDQSHRIIITYPNNDTDPEPLIAMIERFAADRSHVKAVPSLGMRRYAAALHCVSAVVGNSSSGIVEAPSAGIPTLDVGPRQLRRTAAPSVLHCGETTPEIAEGLHTVLSPRLREIAARRENPYYRPDTLRLMCDAICNFHFHDRRPKHFFDL